MSDTRKKEIIMATLELAANKGLGNVSMNMIADKVGIKKPSLYNHFCIESGACGSNVPIFTGRSKEECQCRCD